jgi:hypothetical protein
LAGHAIEAHDWSKLKKIKYVRDNVYCVRRIIVCMTELSPRRVRSAELFRNGIIITFADGKSALFPAELLYASLAEAEELRENEEEEETDG